MSIMRKRLLTIFALFALLAFLAACAQKQPEIPFGGMRATYEVTPGLSLTNEFFKDPSANTETGLFSSTEGVPSSKTDTSLIPEGEEKTPDPINSVVDKPNAEETPTPTKGKPDPNIDFYHYWEGAWHIWFEENGMLLEGKVEFERDGLTMIGKTEINGKSYTFTLINTNLRDIYQHFSKGEWISDSSPIPISMGLWPQNENQAGGYHSQPAQTFCVSRSADEKPDPCFIGLFP